MLEEILADPALKHVNFDIRIDSLPIPQTPWPLVQPLPSLTPKPTSRPPATACYQGRALALG